MQTGSVPWRLCCSTAEVRAARGSTRLCSPVLDQRLIHTGPETVDVTTLSYLELDVMFTACPSCCFTFLSPVNQVGGWGGHTQNERIRFYDSDRWK